MSVSGTTSTKHTVYKDTVIAIRKKN